MREEIAYEQLKKLGSELKIPVYEAFWEFEIRKSGKRFSSLKMRSHSLVRNAYNLLYYYLSGVRLSDTNQLRVQYTSGSYYTSVYYVLANSNQNWDDPGNGLRAPAGTDSFGIVVGSGADAESFESYNLAAKIANGSGAGQLSYTDTEAPAVSTIGTTKKTDWVRYFNNNSGADITVNEVGLIIQHKYPTGTHLFLLERSLIPGGLIVPNTGQLKATYSLQLIYPA